MDCQEPLLFLKLLLLFSTVPMFGVQATNAPGTLPPLTNNATANTSGISRTLIPTPTGEPLGSTLTQNSSTNPRNVSEVQSVANVSGLSASTTISPLTTTSTLNPVTNSVNSTASTSGKTSSTWPSTTGTTIRQTTATTNSTEATATNNYITTSVNITQGPGPSTAPYNGTYTTAISVHAKLRDSEAILTIAFSAILGTVVLVLLVCSLNKCKIRRSQYSHRRLLDTTFDTEDRYAAPEDTLVISGGLYDAPRVYNPSMTVLEDEELHHDYVSFASRPGQFRLEFLPGEKECLPDINSPGFESFHSPHHSL